MLSPTQPSGDVPAKIAAETRTRFIDPQRDKWLNWPERIGANILLQEYYAMIEVPRPRREPGKPRSSNYEPWKGK